MNSFITKLRELKIEISLYEGKLKINSPKGIVTKDILEEIKNNKQELIEYLNNIKNKNIFYASEKSAIKPHYEMSPAQKRLFFLHEFDKNSLAYNISHIIAIEGELYMDRLNYAFNKLIERHESLRTHFDLINEEPFQKISQQVFFEVECFNSDEKDAEIIIKEFIRPFNLEIAPLFRVGLIRLDLCKHILVIDTHHIITDEVSSAILLKEFKSVYKGESLPELNFQYKDYVKWIQSDLFQNEITGQRQFWLDEFAEEIPKLQLPTDFSQSIIKDKAVGN